MRNQNGVTYTMEILEGLKGPSFVVSRQQTFIISYFYLLLLLLNILCGHYRLVLLMASHVLETLQIWHGRAFRRKAIQNCGMGRDFHVR